MQHCGSLSYGWRRWAFIIPCSHTWATCADHWSMRWLPRYGARWCSIRRLKHAPSAECGSKDLKMESSQSDDRTSRRFMLTPKSCKGPKNQTPMFQGRRGRPCRETMIRASRRVLRLKPEALPVRAMATSACGPPRTTRGPLAGRADLRRGLDPQGRGQPLRRPARRRPGQRQLQGLRRLAAMARKRARPKDRA